MRMVRTLAISCTALMVCSAALAQGGRPDRGNRDRDGARQQQRQRMPQLTAEKAEAAWKWQAVTVAHDLKLEQADADKLTETYISARKKMNDAMEQFRKEMRERREKGEGQGEGGQRERGQRGGAGNRELMQNARTNLEASFSSMLSAEQTSRAMASLGTFSAQWDRMVDSLAGMSLETESLHGAIAATNAYMASMSKVRESGDRENMREAMRSMRERLNEDLAKVLSEEQMESMRASLGGRGGMGGQRPARGGDRQGRPTRGNGDNDNAAPSVAKVGESAPNFTLSDANGKSYTLSDYKGKIVVLQWISPLCPVCRGVASSGAVAKMAKDITALSSDAVHLTINSTHNTTAETSAAYLKEHKIKAPALSDRDGKVGHLYDAKTTPHLYVIDAEGVLRYSGAIDDRKDNNYAVQAVRQIVAGDTVTPDTTKPYGCTVKFAK